MPDRFSAQKEHILSQFILHHDVDEKDVVRLAERLDKAVGFAARFHAGQKRKTGEDYVYHPIRTAMEVSRFGRIIDWTSIEASLLHDVLEDTDCTFQELDDDFPEAAGLVDALTKIKDSRQLTYKKLFGYVLQDIRVLLIKLADRLDNLESLGIFSREKQARIANESAQMYANICRRLCMLDLAERLTEKVGQYTVPEILDEFRRSQAQARETLEKPLAQMLSRLAEVFHGDLGARIDVKWLRFNPGQPLTNENFFCLRIITDSLEDAYRALGRVHLSFKAIPGAFTDTVTNPRKNGYRALETSVHHKGGIVRFYITNRAADRFNRLGLLSTDIDSPQFNLQYLEDLKEFLQNEDGDIQDFLRFQRPDAIQVTSPTGEVFSLEEGTTALDFAFAVHDELGLRATGARINDKPSHLAAYLHSGDRLFIETSSGPAVDERYLKWAHSRKALAALRKHLRKVEESRAATTGRQWLIEAAEAAGIVPDDAISKAIALADEKEEPLDSVYRDICLGRIELSEVLGEAAQPKPGLVDSIVRRFTSTKQAERRKVRRYDFNDPHIRFCPACAPVAGDEIEGSPQDGRLVVHRMGCPVAKALNRLPLAWDRTPEAELRDPGPIEMDIEAEGGAGAFYNVVEPFKTAAIDIQTIRIPDGDEMFRMSFQPGSARALDRLIRIMRKAPKVRTIKLMRHMQTINAEDRQDQEDTRAARPPKGSSPSAPSGAPKAP